MNNESPRSPKPRRLILAVSLGLTVAGAASGVWIWHITHQPLSIPTTIAEKALFSLYLPTILPDDYEIDPASYDTAEGVLVFSAANSNGHILNFSEQPKSKDFDITAFEHHLTHATSVPAARYPSVIGQDETHTTLLSTQADNTWLLVTTKATGAEAALKFIAAHLRKQ
ncbi:MAG TPA: hypothetical protein VMT30_00150 [Candidatus Saccharimonadia bacterium]|nr:hypothetical protein [Candidatus Saccharimonadia bacterium]